MVTPNSTLSCKHIMISGELLSYDILLFLSCCQVSSTKQEQLLFLLLVFWFHLSLSLLLLLSHSDFGKIKRRPDGIEAADRWARSRWGAGIGIGIEYEGIKEEDRNEKEIGNNLSLWPLDCSLTRLLAYSLLRSS